MNRPARAAATAVLMCLTFAIYAANEVSTSSYLQLDNGNLKVPRRTMVFKPTQLLAGKDSFVVTIPTNTASTAISLSNISTAGVCQVINMDTGNWCEVGIKAGSDFYPMVKLLAGEGYVFRLATNAPFARANAAPVKLDVLVLER